MITTAPRAVGTCSTLTPGFRPAISESFMAASDAPKSTVWSVMALIPPPEPIAW